MSADGTGRQQVTETPARDEHDPAWSHDGRMIAYVGESSSHGSSSYQLYVSDASGSNSRIITQPAARACTSTTTRAGNPCLS